MSLDLGTLGGAYRNGTLSPLAVVARVVARIAAADPKVWIALVPEPALRARAAELERVGPAGLPLFGVPFAVKDNIDVAGLPTTAACPAYAYTPTATAPVVARLLAAGAILVGKTNLDQFATGLVGVRSPYGVPGNSFDPAFIPGGSSSGSAVAVASGLVSFALGTDTAGSGRVPAAFNNLVGLKPTRGLLSTRGVVAACRTLDCVSVFALTADDAADVLAVGEAYDAEDPFARRRPLTPPRTRAPLRVAVPHPDGLEFFGDRETAPLLAAAVETLRATGAEPVVVDVADFLAAGRLLYQGPWLAERLAAIRDFFTRQADALHPVTRSVIAAGAEWSAVDAALAGYELRRLARVTEAVWADVDALLMPTAPTIYRISEVEQDPVRLNTNLGLYTNFVNLLDLSAVAVPAGRRSDGLPFGVTLIGPAFAEAPLLALGDAFQRCVGLPLGATAAVLPPPRPRAPAAGLLLAVCGAHMTGLPLNRELTARGAAFVERTRTAARYRLFALPGGPPVRPGLVRSAGGAAIEVEVWSLPLAEMGSFMAGIPSPLAIGSVELADGRRVKGFLCEADATVGAAEITHLGGWRAYLR